MKRVSIKELKAAEDALIKLCNFDFPVDISIKLTRFLDDLIPHYQKFLDEHNKIAAAMGSDSKDDSVDIDDEKLEEYNEKVEKLLNKKVKIEKIYMKDLLPYLTEENKMKPVEIRSLTPIIDMD